MEKKRLFLIAHLDEAANRKLAAIYGELAREGLRGVQPPDFPYHITLGSVALKHEKQMTERARKVCARTDVFSVPLSHIGLFGLRVLFAAPSVNCELLNLHRRLVPARMAEDAYEWVPHATLLIDEPENILKAVPIAARAFVPVTATVERVSLYEYPPARFVESFPLRARAAADGNSKPGLPNA